MKNTPAHISFRTSWTITEPIANLLGQCYAFIRAITHTPISPDDREKLLRVSLRKGALATTAIEGNTLTEDDLDSIEAGHDLPPSRRYLQQEVLNIRDALDVLRRDLLEGGRRPDMITPAFIRRLHRMVAKGLGERYGGSGCFRRRNVTVGAYRPPPFEQVEGLVEELCAWLRREFHYSGGQNFDDTVIGAVVSHVYMVWIHPFLDGNGRTARLMEFYMLLRAGVPDIASHILSNHYNNTRDAYYRHLQKTVETGDLTDFLRYALEGFRDGLEQDVLGTIQDGLMDGTWEGRVYETTEKLLKEGTSKKVVDRVRILATALSSGPPLPFKDILNTAVGAAYGGLTPATLRNDLKLLIRLNLVAEEDGRYRGNKESLNSLTASVLTEIKGHY
ncbi:MAG: Fic family protein [Spirochaetaceae bacterium]|nr:Fic family protein [Spirochaetaceae bacterium]